MEDASVNLFTQIAAQWICIWNGSDGIKRASSKPWTLRARPLPRHCRGRPVDLLRGSRSPAGEDLRWLQQEELRILDLEHSVLLSRVPGLDGSSFSELISLMLSVTRKNIKGCLIRWHPSSVIPFLSHSFIWKLLLWEIIGNTTYNFNLKSERLRLSQGKRHRFESRMDPVIFIRTVHLVLYKFDLLLCL